MEYITKDRTLSILKTVFVAPTTTNYCGYLNATNNKLTSSFGKVKE